MLRDKKPITMKIRITKENQPEITGVIRMFQHALRIAIPREMDRNNVMVLMSGAMGEDSIGEFILVPLPPKPVMPLVTTDPQEHINNAHVYGSSTLIVNVDKSVPDGEAHVRVGGKVVGKIIGIEK